MSLEMCFPELSSTETSLHSPHTHKKSERTKKTAYMIKESWDSPEESR